MTKATRFRYILYAAAVAAASLLVIEAVVTLLWRSGVVELSRQNDQAWVRNRAPWVDQGDGTFGADPTAPLPMLDHRFRTQKGDAFRVFLIGESFMAGVGALSGLPEASTTHPDVGRIHWWLRQELERRFPTATFEIINASLEGQDSSRMVETLGFVLEHSPDLVILATCNNEGSDGPGAVERGLNDLSTVRALRQALSRDEAPPVHTPQALPASEVEVRFRRNLRTMASMSQRAGVPLLIATLPVNLLYDGDEAGLLLPGGVPRSGAVAGSYARCVIDGIEAYRAGRLAAAHDALDDCDDAEALRWLGLVQFARGDVVTAAKTLSASVQLTPRNRCPKVLQATIRDVARNSPGASLIDLEEKVISASPSGLPGPSLFVDYCHMNWRGQAIVARSFAEAMVAGGLVPADARAPVGLLDVDAVFEAAVKRRVPP